MNVVIYARFSSHSQTEQSIEGQLKVCYEYARQYGHVVIGEYIDRAQSGTTDNRSDFQRMIEDSSKNLYERIVVYRFNRFFRNKEDHIMEWQYTQWTVCEKKENGEEQYDSNAINEALSWFFAWNSLDGKG